MKRVLIADDSKSIRLSLDELLTSCGLSVTQTSDGAECLKKAREEAFDLIVTDLDMPVMNGFELCAELKKDPRTRTIPIIILSSLATEERIEAAFTLGAWAFVPKSEPEELEKCIQIWMDRHITRHQTKVLLVDDSPSILDVVSKELTCDGYEVATCPNGQEALDLLMADYRPDIIVCDLHMPVLDGLSLLARLRKNTRLAAIPFVMMSADPGRASVMKTIQAGATSYLTKPFGSGQLAIHLDRILSDQFRILDAARKRLEHEQILFMAAMTSLVNALEAKDHYTRGHSESVAELSVLIGRGMGLDAATLERLELAGRLHDLGKIGIRDEVLLKPGKLTEQEYEHIKSHSLIVGTILSPIPSVQDIVEAAVSHHERWDGQGYPHQLAGESIPLFGRILAVADVYDALTSQRAYRARMTPAEALGIIREGIGSHFCPTVAAVFLEMMESA